MSSQSFQLGRSSLINAFWISLRYLSISLSGLLVSLAFARFGSKELLGQYQFVISLLAIFSIFTLPGLNMAAIKAVANGNLRAVGEAVRLSFRSSLLAVPLIIAYGCWRYLEQPTFGLTVVISGLLFPFFYAPNTWYVFYEGRGIFLPVVIRTTLATILSSAGLILAIWLQASLLEILLVFLGINSVLTGYFYLEVSRRLQSEPGKSSLDRRYGLSVTGQKFAFTLTDSLPPLIITFLLGSVAVANYQVAVAFFNAMASFMGALAVLYLPYLFTKRTNNERDIISKNLLVGLVSTLVYYLAVRWLFTRLFGGHYQDSYLLALGLAPLVVIGSLKTYFVNYLTAKERNTQVVTSYLLANGLAVTALFVTYQTSFSKAITLYIYTLNLSLLLLLLLSYAQQVRADNRAGK